MAALSEKAVSSLASTLFRTTTTLPRSTRTHVQNSNDLGPHLLRVNAPSHTRLLMATDSSLPVRMMLPLHRYRPQPPQTSPPPQHHLQVTQLVSRMRPVYLSTAAFSLTMSLLLLLVMLPSSQLNATSHVLCTPAQTSPAPMVRGRIRVVKYPPPQNGYWMLLAWSMISTST